MKPCKTAVTDDSRSVHVKILMISDVYFPRINGVSTSIFTFRRELECAGHSVQLIAPDYGRSTPDETWVTRVSSRYLPLDPEDRMAKLSAIMKLLPALRNAGFDIIHIHTPFVAHRAGIRLANALGLPVVESYHTFFEEYLYYYVPFFPRSVMRFAARHFSYRQCNQVDALVVPSASMLEVLRDYGVRTHAEIIPTGIDLEQFAAGSGVAFRARHGIDPEWPVLVHVGRVAHEKNIGFLLEVVARVRQTVPEVLLIVAGEGPALKALKRKAVVLGIGGHVLFVGYLDRQRELLDCYRAGDAFVFASRTETQGLVLLEAMALGVPVVSTAVMGTRDVLRDGEGALIATEQVDDFAGHVVRLLQDAALRHRLSVAATTYAAQWSAARMAERMVDFYQDVIQKNQLSVATLSRQRRAAR